MTTVQLPFPPSTNNLFLNVRGRGRIRSKAYRAWSEAASWELLSQRPAKLVGPVAVCIHLVAPNKRRMDADNRIKPVLDLLVEHSIIQADDSRIVKEIKAVWAETGSPCRVEILPLQ